MKLRRTTFCGTSRIDNENETLTVAGWVDTIREIGGLVFIDLRDQTGILQLVFDRTDDAETLERAKRLGREYVIAAKGKLRRRERENADLPTGQVELLVEELELLNEAKTPPIEVRDDVQIDPELRMKYRYLDLRRPSMGNVLRVRSELVSEVRRYFAEQGFVDVETPMLTKATPEGARDFVVPARQHPGLFYALPQSPQIFKQILMVSGVDKYVQIVRCFRDEDKRADRQPEFTQLDVEMCFVAPEDVYSVIEGCVSRVMKAITGKEITTPIPHIPYSEALQKYGIDRPDMRFAMPLTDLTESLRGCGFKAFAATIDNGGIVKALRIPGGDALLSKGQFKTLEKDAKGRGAKGLAFIRYKEEGLDSPIAKFFNEAELATIQQETGAKTGDLVLFVADRKKVVNGILAEYRNQFADKKGLLDNAGHNLLWVDDFPLFEYDEEDNRLYAAHHPFTSPADEDLFFELAEEMRRSDRQVTPKIIDLAERVKANAYDLILNGKELGGGSIRIHNRKVQDAMFDCLGIGPEEAEAKFGFLLEALSYGAPPMGGIALGIDRWVMEVLGFDNIQDVIAFPKTGAGKGLMDGSPAPVDASLLDELQISSLALQGE